MPTANEVRESRMPEIGPSGLKRAEAAKPLPLRYSTDLLFKTQQLLLAH
jgi:hypothetical protein